jgi:WD40 repeat protein
VHSFKGHNHAISGIEFINEGILFVTASLDQTVRIWSIENFSQQYSFDLGFGPEKIWLVGHKHFVALNDKN